MRTLATLLLWVVMLGFATSDAQVPPDSVYYTTDVAPLLTRAGCVECHGTQKGKGGLKLSMFGAEPEADYLALTKATAGRRINRIEPLKSLFLQKATAAIKHGGGERFKPDSPEHKLLARWITQGAPFANPDAPALVAVKVDPKQRTFKPGEKQKLTVTAVFADKSEKNVTGDATFETSNEAAATVAGNEVTAGKFGEATIIVGYSRKFDTMRATIPRAAPGAFPDVKPNNKIDELVFAKLKQMGIPPSGVSSDHEFVRRVYLDVIGTLPTSEQAKAFLADKDPQKRAKLIDHLLACDEFADYWALKWGDLFRMKSEYPSNLWPNAVQAYHRWVRDSIANNKPYDQFATELITSSGSNFRVPPVNYYRAFLKRESRNLAEVTALIFMGARVGCARCHAHPSEDWNLDDSVGLAAFFAPVRYKRTQEWKEEVVYVDPRATMSHPRTSKTIKPTVLGGEPMELTPGEDPRVRFATWLTAPDNPWFAKNIVNRTWFWLLGRGIIHEPDDLRPTNPPSNPELIAYLEKELVDHKYDLKHIYRLILNSKTYQRSSKATDANKDDTMYFSHYPVKRLGAETLLDAIGQVTGKWDIYQSRIPEPFVKMPAGFRATHLADGSIGIPFLTLFGRPPRDTAFESDRDLNLSMRQTLHLLNSSDVQGKINASPRLRKLMVDIKENPPLLEELFYSTVSRPPTEAERNKVLAYMSGEGKSPPPELASAKKAAEEALAKVRAEHAKAKTDYANAEKLSKAADGAAATAKAAVPKTAAARTTAEKTAAAKRQAANAAKKAADDLAKAQPPAPKTNPQLETAKKALATVNAEKAASIDTLAKSIVRVAQAQQAHDAAEKAAKEAEAQAEAGGEKSDAEATAAKVRAQEKRANAMDAKAALTQAQQSQQDAQRQAFAMADRFLRAEAAVKAAQSASAPPAAPNEQVLAARKKAAAAEETAKAAETAAASAKAAAASAVAAQAATQKDAADKKKSLADAKVRRDKLAASEKTATTNYSKANQNYGRAMAALKPRRDQAFQDLLWALLNTKEFLFNH